MSKALAATCVDGIVKVGEMVVPETQILSEGIAQSEGVILLDEAMRFYLAKITPDLKLSIEKTIAALQGAIDGIDAVSGSLGTIAAATADLGAIAAAAAASAQASAATSAIAEAKGALEELKGNLK